MSQSFRAFISSFFYFCLSSILFQNFTRSFFALYFCFRFVLLQSLVVQFSMTNSAVPSNVQLRYYITSYSALSSTFLNFFSFFSYFTRSFVCDPVILPHLFPFVNTFFESFLKKFVFFVKLRIHRQIR